MDFSSFFGTVACALCFFDAEANEVTGQKKEAVPPQHYLSPNQIKPNYLISLVFGSTKVNPFV
jgi:hypothetical protein